MYILFAVTFLLSPPSLVWRGESKTAASPAFHGLCKHSQQLLDAPAIRPRHVCWSRQAVNYLSDTPDTHPTSLFIMRPTQLLATIASFSALTQAWPWPDFSKRNSIMRRQDSSNSDSSTSNSATATAKTSSQTGKTTSATNTKSQSGTKTTSGSSASKTDSGNSDSGNSTSTGSAAATTSFDGSEGLGSVVMINPSALAGSTYYKVGDYITWGWNYTNVQATPTAVDLWAFCSAAKATYTLATNMTYDEKGQYTWDTAAYATQAPQLGTNSYTLSIADAEIGPSGSKGAGYLNPVAMYTFAMYTPQPYSNLSGKSISRRTLVEGIKKLTQHTDWTCATCNSGAASLTPKNTWSFLGGMASLTILSFTWFATGRFGVL